MRVRLITSKGKWTHVSTGKGFFAVRLMDAMRRLGVEFTSDETQPVDIDLQFSRWHYKPKNCKRTVLRLGPCHVDKQKNHKWLNERKAKAARKVDGIVFQSQFAKKMWETFVKPVKCPNRIIFNGAPTDYEIKSVGMLYQGKVNFIASTRTWLKQKRLKQLMNAFFQADIPGSYLHIFGDTSVFEKYEGNEIFVGQTFVLPGGGPVIKVYGPTEQWRLKVYMDLPNAIFLHPVYLDACPNSVVEALCAGLRVICGDQGGTKELVRDNGTIIPDKPWNFKAINLDKPPKLNIEAWAQAMRGEVEKDSVDFTHVDIDNIAKQYLDFFKSLL